MIETETPTDSRPGTYEHILTVQRFLLRAVANLQQRCLEHDQSKLVTPEVEAFDVISGRLQELPYGSAEYRASLREMKPAITHHYELNTHHPEHYEDGILGMDLLDLVEMLADWKAAALRQPESLSLGESIERNQARWGYSDEIKHILLNTVPVFDEHLS